MLPRVLPSRGPAPQVLIGFLVVDDFSSVLTDNALESNGDGVVIVMH